MTYLIFCFGLVLLITGGEVLVRNGVKLAHKLKLSPLMIGIILMGVGTSLPELSASLSALFANPPTPGIAFGNVIGSNISNILFILGLSALISPIKINKESFKRDGSFLIISALMLGLIMLFGRLDSIIGLFFILCISGYFAICYDKEPEPENLHLTKKQERSVLTLGCFAIFGIASIVYGANLLVDSATKIATLLGIPQATLGLTMVALGTSLPEVTVSVVAAMHKHSAIAYGNVIGSNIANIFLIIGVMGMARATDVPQLWSSYFIMIAVTTLILICGIIGKIPRWTGLLFLTAYAAYICFLFK